nr:PH domain-containing protein [Nanchangia anserum]
MWLRTGYRLDADAVAFRHGLISTTNRRVPLDRVQAVNISRPLLARVLGLGNVIVESAGGRGSHVTIGLLNNHDLDRLRDEINARVARIHTDSEDAHAAAPGCTDEPSTARTRWETRMRADDRFDEGDHRLYNLSVDTLVRSRMWSLSTIVSVVLLIGALVAVVVMFVVIKASFLTILTTSLPWLVPILGLAGNQVRKLSVHYNTRIDATRGGLRLSRGLTSTESQVLAPGRIHGIVLKQDPLWRSRGWWTIDLIIAAYQGANENARAVSRTLTPVASVDEIALFLRAVLPEFAESSTAQSVLDAAMHGRGADGGFLAAARGGRIFSPLAYPRLGAYFQPTAFVTRSGWLYREVTIIDPAHVQGVTISAGPFDRRCAMADVTAHAVGGLTSRGVILATHLNEADAFALRTQLAAHARVSRDLEAPAKWRERMRNLADVNAPRSAVAAPDGATRETKVAGDLREWQ